MENIADALRIAAGVLFAVLLISLIVYIFRASNTVEAEKQQQILIAQVNEFNSTFNAYHKSQMYGTDVMSVLSLAINNNRDLNSERAIRGDGLFHNDIEGSVNIRVKMTKPIEIKRYTIVTTINIDDPNDVITEGPNYEKQESYFKDCTKQGDYYTLADLKTVEKFQNMITDNNAQIQLVKHVVSNYGLTTTNTYEDNFGIRDFKTCIFTCSDVKYRSNGQIYEMTFEETKLE